MPSLSEVVQSLSKAVPSLNQVLSSSSKTVLNYESGCVEVRVNLCQSLSEVVLQVNACGICPPCTYMASVMTKFIPLYFTSVLHEIAFKQNVLNIIVNLVLCPFLAS